MIFSYSSIYMHQGLIDGLVQDYSNSILWLTNYTNQWIFVIAVNLSGSYNL